VSAIGLGTMTFGEQNTEADGHAQIDYALDQGVNLIDTAEMYSVPPRADTYGSTERIIGTWLKKRGKRDRIVLCTKVAGPTRVLQVDHVRGGANVLDRKNILAAIDSSLQRLQTDYVDVYQLHWPDRSTNFFGRLDCRHTEHEDTVPIEETLEVMTDLVRDGKIRHVGVSNETPWGLHRFLQVADQRGLARVVSIQNPYNLLSRSFEIGLAEMAIREDVGLLAYSPLAFGVLSGKFLGGARPPESRADGGGFRESPTVCHQYPDRRHHHGTTEGQSGQRDDQLVRGRDPGYRGGASSAAQPMSLSRANRIELAR
jgi:aryl-alcohol dehydrogenase-like predicted oxidoreductase